MSNQIDVAKIMHEIRANVIPDDYSYTESKDFDELKRIVWERREDNQNYIEIGSHLPQGKRFPGIIRLMIQIVARAVRKATRFMMVDQIIVNRNVDSSLDALSQCDEVMYNKLMSEIEKLKKENQELSQKVAALSEKK